QRVERGASSVGYGLGRGHPGRHGPPGPVCGPGATTACVPHALRRYQVPRAPGRVAGRHVGRGWETERGMIQGPRESAAPGETVCAPSPFVRDAVVFDDYTIAEAMVRPQGAIRRRYPPQTCPTLPQQLARVSRGDTTAVLTFVRTYGLLGYAPLAAAV